MMLRRRAKNRAAVLLCALGALCAMAVILSSERLPSAERPSSARRGKKVSPIDLVIVPERCEWLISVAAPLTARLTRDGKVPALVALAWPPTEEAAKVLEQLSPTRCLVLCPDAEPSLQNQFPGVEASILVTGNGPAEGALRVARRVWGETDEVVVASIREPAAMILGSTLAAHLRVPFIPLGSEEDTRSLRKAFSELGVKRALLVSAEKTLDARLENAPPRRVEALDAPSIERIVVEHVGASRVRNVILTRVPTPGEDNPSPAWMASYLSFVRGAPIVLCESADGKAAQAAVEKLIATHGLKPRSVSILAHYDSIGTIKVFDPENVGEEEVEIEPCSAPGKGGAAALAVGRIPCKGLSQASALIARGIVREKMFADKLPRVVMVASPKTEYTALPLCETISRATAQEFKNFGLHIDEFYRLPPTDDATLSAAEKAHLIVFEGHATDLVLFGSSPFGVMPTYFDEGESWEYEYQPTDYYQPWSSTSPDYVTPEPEPEDGESSNYLTPEPEPEFDPASTNGQGQDEESLLPLPETATNTEGEAETETTAKKVKELDGLPVIVLQSCHSLEEISAGEMFDLGAAALVGSASNVYSATGSAVAKAFCDGLLYRGDTVGEALRDARNYSFCLAKLKAMRGQKEQTKVYRSGLSFRLWGDPEVRAFYRPLPKAKRQPVSARFAETHDGLVVSTAKQRLPESKTDEYIARLFPASQTAGIVKHLKNEPQRRLAPVYFFRLPASENFLSQKYNALGPQGYRDVRAAFLTDPFDRFIYVVYLPEKEKGGERIALKFSVENIPFWVTWRSKFRRWGWSVRRLPERLRASDLFTSAPSYEDF